MEIRSLFLAAALALPAAAAPTAYTIDPSHSVASFTVRHMMVSNVRGEMGKVSGTVVYDKDDPTKSSVEATIDVKGISTRDEKRDGHLRSPDFFDVAKHPEMKFKSTKVEKVADGKLKVTGELTLHGVTRQVTLEAEGPSAEVKNPMAPILMTGFAAATRINRKDYGISWGPVMDNGGMVVSDNVDVQLEVELDRPDPAAKAAPAKK